MREEGHKPNVQVQVVIDVALDDCRTMVHKAVALAVLQEREACAQIAEGTQTGAMGTTGAGIARAIRDREGQ